MECEYCGKILSNKYILKTHQSTKSCLKIQQTKNIINVVKTFKCDYCDKYFNVKNILHVHMETCKKKKEYENSIILKEKENTDKLKMKIEIYEEIISKFNINTINNNNINCNNKNIYIGTINIDDAIKKCAKNFNGEYYNDGSIGVANCIIDNILKDEEGNLLCKISSKKDKTLKYEDKNKNIKIIDIRELANDLEDSIIDASNNIRNNRDEIIKEMHKSDPKLLKENGKIHKACINFNKNKFIKNELNNDRDSKDKRMFFKRVMTLKSTCKKIKNYKNCNLDFLENPSNINDIECIDLSVEKIKECINKYDLDNYKDGLRNLQVGIYDLAMCIINNLLSDGNKLLYISRLPQGEVTFNEYSLFGIHYKIKNIDGTIDVKFDKNLTELKTLIYTLFIEKITLFYTDEGKKYKSTNIYNISQNNQLYEMLKNAINPEEKVYTESCKLFNKYILNYIIKINTINKDHEELQSE